LGVLVGIVYAIFTAVFAGTYKYFLRNSSPFWGGDTWKRVTVDEAKKHPLYGISGWLVLFAFSTLLGFF